MISCIDAFHGRPIILLEKTMHVDYSCNIIVLYLRKFVYLVFGNKTNFKKNSIIPYNTLLYMLYDFTFKTISILAA